MMKKRLITFIFLFSVVLSACGGSNSTPEPDATQTPPPTTAPPLVTAKCTAQSVEPVDYAQPGDWITGATEGYAVTLVEYANFQ
jgi:hypothetical protein